MDITTIVTAGVVLALVAAAMNMTFDLKDLVERRSARHRHRSAANSEPPKGAS